MEAGEEYGRKINRMRRFACSLLIGWFVSICLPTLGVGQTLMNCGSQECYNDQLNAQRAEALDRIIELGNSPQLAADQAPIIAVAYYNSLTDEFFVGDRTFHRDDHEAALDTQGKRNTAIPVGIGWRPIAETQYIGYMRMVMGLDTPIDHIIYNNCVVARSRELSDSVTNEVRTSCRETARNPSMLDRWRWGD